jgi:hypothetical protein
MCFIPAFYVIRLGDAWLDGQWTETLGASGWGCYGHGAMGHARRAHGTVRRRARQAWGRAAGASWGSARRERRGETSTEEKQGEQRGPPSRRRVGARVRQHRPMDRYPSDVQEPALLASALVGSGPSLTRIDMVWAVPVA